MVCYFVITSFEGGELSELAKATLRLRASNNIIPEFLKQNHVGIQVFALLIFEKWLMRTLRRLCTLLYIEGDDA